MGTYLRIHVDLRTTKPDEDWVARQMLHKRLQTTIIVFSLCFVLLMVAKMLYEGSLPSLQFTLWAAIGSFFAGIYYLPLLQYILTGWSATFNERMVTYTTIYIYRIDRMLADKNTDASTTSRLWRHRAEVHATLLRIEKDWPRERAEAIDTSMDEPPHQFEAEGAPVIEPYGSTTSNA